MPCGMVFADLTQGHYPTTWQQTCFSFGHWDSAHGVSLTFARNMKSVKDFDDKGLGDNAKVEEDQNGGGLIGYQPAGVFYQQV